MKGKHPKRVIPEDRKQSVHDHIMSIPRVESHYCRSTTRKEYFETTINLKILYEMYKEYCNDRTIVPVQEHMYRHIYNYEYNIEFLKPKKDRCDKCEEFRNNADASDEEKEKFEEHLRMKTETKVERDNDRVNKERAIICFDLENVLSLPRANISSFFYRRKLSVYNLTAHCSLDKNGYCAIWSEGLSGRTGNDIASSLIRILEKVMGRHPDVKDIVLWSDSCVAQNRNSIMCVALKDFLKRYPFVNSITQKFCQPGHSSIQEVDAVHSLIERTLKKCEVFSPVSLMRILPSVNRKHPLIVLQMRHEHFFDYQSVSKLYKYSDIPFTKTKQIMYLSTHPYHVLYKTSHTENFLEVRIVDRRPERNINPNLLSPLPKIKSIPISSGSLLSQDKIKDLTAMLKFMPAVDRQYVKAICRL
ncbi:uncharacterized protein LOC130012334 [Patella vulgata]|uniref:uncharacterized protein LOC130012334 n=1 Tax=Patella vulgata TaxID=6465 RepID=UPI0024A90F2D|nr:uncharacterized protein LOC130012334 [Patella vulgata]